MIPIAEIINGFSPETLAVRRVDDATTYVDGLAQVVGGVSTFTVTDASVQPMLARERQLLPELIRDKGMLKVYSRTLLQSVDVEGKKRADRLTYKSQNYVVQSVEDWASHGDYYKIVAVKEDD